MFLTIKYFLIGIVALMLIASTSSAGGRYSCKQPEKKFNGVYSIFVIPDEENLSSSKEILGKILSFLRSSDPSIYNDARFEVKVISNINAVAFNEYNYENTLFIGIGNVSVIEDAFHKSGIKNGVAIPSFSEDMKVIKVKDYYHKMLTHAMYRGLLQLNGERQSEVSSIPLDHISQNDIKMPNF